MDEDVKENLLEAWDIYIENDRHYQDDGEEYDARQRFDHREERLEPTRELIGQFLDDELPLEEFRREIDSENKSNSLWGFTGTANMFFNKLVKISRNEGRIDDCTDLLQNVIQPPTDSSEANERIEALGDFVSELQSVVEDGRSAPFHGNMPMFLSYFWHIQEPDRLLPYYESCRDAYKELDIWKPSGSHGEKFATFWEATIECQEVIESERGEEVHLWDLEYAMLHYDNTDHQNGGDDNGGDDVEEEDNLPGSSGKLTTDAIDLSAIAENTGFSSEDIELWIQALKRKQQAVFYGPPGTGKTYVTEQIAEAITEESDGFYDLVQFHHSYEYEDFIQGIRPSLNGDSLTYELQEGTFLEFCAEAEEREDPCVLILDEINRADVSTVFGELMYLLEYRGPGNSVQLAQHNSSDEGFQIPTNVYILGTMNTADRSIALVDFALRRRFAFIPLYPNYDILRKQHAETGINIEELIDLLKEINEDIGDRQYWIGYTYFLDVDVEAEFASIWQLEIEPYLEEYFVDDPETVSEYRWANVQDRLL